MTFSSATSKNELGAPVFTPKWNFQEQVITSDQRATLRPNIHSPAGSQLWRGWVTSINQRLTKGYHVHWTVLINITARIGFHSNGPWNNRHKEKMWCAHMDRWTIGWFRWNLIGPDPHYSLAQYRTHRLHVCRKLRNLFCWENPSPVETHVRLHVSTR